VTGISVEHEQRVTERGNHMKFALVSGQRQEAQPCLSAECPTCGHPMVARCGEVKVWHWAHLGGHLCDPWWEPDTDWHRGWKDRFPIDWQEVVHHAENGEKHIADVKTDRGWAIEFQHSYLKSEERRSRDTFYSKLIWVVDGARRKRDRAQLLKAWNEGVPIGVNSPVRKAFSDEFMLLREWAGGNAPIFFDFREPQLLWWLFARSTGGLVFLAPYSRASFIESHRGGGTPEAAREFDEFMKDVPKLVADYESHRRTQSSQLLPTLPLRRRGRF
jgi:competence protein CoiA